MANIPIRFLGHSSDAEETRRVYLLFFISVIGITTLLALGILALSWKNMAVGISDLLLALILIGNILHAKRYKQFAFNIYLGIFCGAMLLVYMFLTGGVNRSGAFVWYYPFPLAASFLLGSRKGAIATILILLPAIGLFLLESPPPPLVSYDLDFKIRFIFSFSLVFLFSYLFEYSRERNREELRKAQGELEEKVTERTAELLVTNEQLKRQIEERKRAEEALELTQFSVNCSADPIVWIRQDGRLIDLNEAFCRCVGYSREELISMHVHDIDPEYSVEAWPEFWERLKRAGTLKYESYYHTKEGQILPVEISSNFLKYKDREYHCSFVRDMTSHRHAEEGLRASEERFRTLVETVPDVIFSLSTGGILTSLNPAFEKVTGWSRDEWVGKSFHTMVHPDDLAQATGHLLNALAGKMSPIFEIRIRSKSGRYLTGEFIGAPHIKDGNVIEMIGFARDITDRKMAEEVLKEKTEKLARSNRELEEFTYVASHDLQEPLRMVTNFAQLLAKRYKGRLDSDADDFINFAVDGALRMWKLINDLLAYSRVGAQRESFEAINCEAILQQSLDNLKATVEESAAEVTHDFLPTVMADGLQLDQLFQNLIGNAIKFRGDERPRIHVSASRNDSRWTFSVRDNGIGIAPEYAERIFIIFQRLHGRQEYPGTGIGLAVCKKIVEQHGGRIWVESDPRKGKGATFYFTLTATGIPQP